MAGHGVGSSADEADFRDHAIWQTLEVPWEKRGHDRMSGQCGNYLRVFTPAECAEPNTLQRIVVRREQDGELRDEPVAQCQAQETTPALNR